MKFPSVVSDVMHKIISVDCDVYVYEAAQKMIENKIGSIVVTVDGKPAGIITRSDMIKRVIVAYKDPREHKTKTIMSTPLISIHSDTPILEAMRHLRDSDVNQILVEQDGELVGIVSEGDMVRAVTLSSLTQFSSLLRRP